MDYCDSLPGLAINGSWPSRIAARHPWMPFVLPLVVFGVLGFWEPKPVAEPKEIPPAAAAQVQPDAAPAGRTPAEGEAEKTAENGRRPGRNYPLYYTIRIAATLAVLLFFTPVYLQFRWRVGWLAPAVGLIGAGLWIGLCLLNLEAYLAKAPLIGSLLATGGRAAFDPFVAFEDRPGMIKGFLAVRFLGLVLVVPLMEEFFLRGFLSRYVIAPNWTTISPGSTNRMVWICVIVYAAATHPAELFAAVAWFSLVTWMFSRTRSLGDCVVAHATTNLVLGVFVVATGTWRLW